MLFTKFLFLPCFNIFYPPCLRRENILHHISACGEGTQNEPTSDGGNNFRNPRIINYKHKFIRHSVRCCGSLLPCQHKPINIANRVYDTQTDATMLRCIEEVSALWEKHKPWPNSTRSTEQSSEKLMDLLKSKFRDYQNKYITSQSVSHILCNSNKSCKYFHARNNFGKFVFLFEGY